ncbi:FAD/NAD(P)-binding domain-containing protein [Byssothecium circinans]|uniref:FAD/NAD(P)-binding domain-containing protein n=1 Tax=Byssothecium circinans TaxID=147558 RepID=A0A6A5TPX5_9PLEO|nr:FAD/NAD(P)-binding domain-containing protein [Byssothecium circinans]
MARKLNITIVGGGISGLLAARVLREKHNVTIVERDAGNHEFSAAITLGPTAINIIESLGFDRKRGGTMAAEKVLVWNKNLDRISENITKKYTAKLSGEFTFSYRRDVWDEFLRLATSDEFPGGPVKILWESNMGNVDVETGTVYLDDGRKIESDLVIAADGIRSSVRHLVLQKDESEHARPSGSSAFRFTVPGDVVREIHLKHGRTDDPLAPNMNLYMSIDGTQRTCVTYPCRSGKLLSCAFVVPDKLIARETEESWAAEAEEGEIRRLFHDFNPVLLDLADRAEKPRCWRLRDQDPLHSYTRGCTMLIGDAAHAMTPHLGQGGTQAIEDAAAFELFNDPDYDAYSVPEILQMMDRVRRQRATRIQTWTREFQTWKKKALEEKYTWYCWTYPGIKECLKRLDAGLEMIELKHFNDADAK